MKYKLGDFVRFVDEKMEGFVTRIIDEQMIGVTGTDDFEIPVLAGKVTYVHGYNQPGERDDGDSQTVPLIVDFKEKGVTLAITNDNKAKSVVHFSLINETSFQLLFALTTRSGDKYKGEYNGIIQPASVAKLYSAS